MCSPLNPTKRYEIPIRSEYQFTFIQAQQKPLTHGTRSAQFVWGNTGKMRSEWSVNTCLTELVSEKRMANAETKQE